MRYINNKKLYYEVIISQALGRKTLKLDKMLILIADNVITKFKYYDEFLKEDCYAEGVYVLFKNWHTFNSILCRTVSPKL